MYLFSIELVWNFSALFLFHGTIYMRHSFIMRSSKNQCSVKTGLITVRLSPRQSLRMIL